LGWGEGGEWILFNFKVELIFKSLYLNFQTYFPLERYIGYLIFIQLQERNVK